MLTPQVLCRYPQTREALQRAVRVVQEAEEAAEDDYYNASEEKPR